MKEIEAIGIAVEDKMVPLRGDSGTEYSAIVPYLFLDAPYQLEAGTSYQLGDPEEVTTHDGYELPYDFFYFLTDAIIKDDKEILSDMEVKFKIANDDTLYVSKMPVTSYEITDGDRYSTYTVNWNNVDIKKITSGTETLLFKINNLKMVYQLNYKRMEWHSFGPYYGTITPYISFGRSSKENTDFNLMIEDPNKNDEYPIVGIPNRLMGDGLSGFNKPKVPYYMVEGLIKGVLIANSKHVFNLEPGAVYMLFTNSHLISNDSWRGTVSYIIASNANTGANTTALGAPHGIQIGLSGTTGVALKYDTRTAYKTGSSSTYYAPRLGIGACTTNCKVRYSLFKVMGSTEDFTDANFS